jgi:membrane-bound lytic murein transglycosylase B
VRERYPGFTLRAEVHWDLEWTLQQQGFDYACDKRLYDRLRDLLGPACYAREGDELAGRGLYLDLPPWGHHLFEVTESASPEASRDGAPGQMVPAPTLRLSFITRLQPPVFPMPPSRAREEVLAHPRVRIAVSLPVLALLAACGSSPPRVAATDPVPAVAAALDPVRDGKPGPASPVPPAGARGATEVSGDYAGYPAVRDLIDRLEREQGFDRQYLSRVFSRIERQQWILDFVTRPSPPPAAGPTGSWTRYRDRFLTEDRIEKGLDFWQEHAADLARAQERYGVPPEYVVAIIGVETHYGANVGRQRVVDALATLAFDFPRRAAFFTQELESFLIMARNEGFDPFDPVGSYAGAMGLGQFMPSSFHRFAVDFDGDGRRDLWNATDTVGSVANYFREHGWREAESVAVPARAHGEAPQALEAGLTTRYGLDRLAEHGVTAAVPLDSEGELSLLRLDAAGGYQYWLGFPNFYVITRYNQSTQYAMAVHQLAQVLRQRWGRATEPILSVRRQPASASAL